MRTAAAETFSSLHGSLGMLLTLAGWHLVRGELSEVRFVFFRWEGVGRGHSPYFEGPGECVCGHMTIT